MKKLFKFLAYSLLVIVILILVIVSLAPTIASSRWGQERVVEAINRIIPGELKVESFTLTWFGDQEIRGLVLRDAEGREVLKFEDFITETSLLRLVREGPKYGVTQVDKLSLFLEGRKDFHTNLEAAIGLKLLPPIPLTSPLELSDVTLYINEPKAPLPALREFSGNSRYGTVEGSFHFNAVMEKEERRLEADISHFPVALLDSYLTGRERAWEGLALYGLGETVNLNIKETLTKAGAAFQFEIESLRVKGKGSFSLNDGFFQILKPITLSFDFPKELPKRLQGSWHLGKDLKGELTIERLNLPDRLMVNSLFSPQDQFLFEGVVAVPDLVLVNEGGKREWKDAEMALSLHEKEDHYIVNCQARAVEEKKPLEAKLEGELFEKAFKGYLDTPFLRLKNIDLECDGPWVSPFAISHGEARIESAEVLIGEGATFKNIDMSFEFDRGPPSMEVHLKGESQGGPMTGHLKWAHWNTTAPSYELTLEGKKMPTIVDRLILGESLFGPFVDATIHLDYGRGMGTVLADMKGEKGSLFLDGVVKNDVVTLKKPLTLHVEEPIRLKKISFLKPLRFLDFAKSSENPLDLKIDPEGFSYPIKAQKETEIGSGSLLIGKWTLYNKGDVKKLIKLLQKSAGESINIWATPLYFSYHKGVLKLERCDILFYDRYRLALFGEIDLWKEKVHLNLGISGEALTQALNVSVDKEAMLLLPIKGHFDQIHVDMEKAALEIAALLAKKMYGQEGEFVGAMLDMAGLKGKEKVPPAKQKPYPWGEIAPPEERKELPKVSLEDAAKKLLKRVIIK